MKRVLKIVCLLTATLLLVWYFSPQVYRILHLPDAIDPQTELYAPAISAHARDARLVRESGDERITDRSERKADVVLLGFLPLRTVTVSAGNRTVSAGGEAVGVVLKTEGVQIVGFEKIESAKGTVCPAVSAGLREGDMITALNGQAVCDSETFAQYCAASDDTCVLTYLRDGESFSVTLEPAEDGNGEKRIGAWVRDSTSGIGTISFYDRETGVYAALGHGVTDVDTQKLIAPATGFLTDASILQVRKSGGDSAGELIGQFSVSKEDAIGTVEQNTVFGISGRLASCPETDARSFEIASCSAAHKGDAYILSDVDGEVRPYAVRVIRVDVQSSPQAQGMMIEITDPGLLEKTGGIVQGMSGSPLIQDGRLIGVVTHVFLSRPTRGYCIYAEWMANALFT